MHTINTYASINPLSAVPAKKLARIAAEIPEIPSLIDRLVKRGGMLGAKVVLPEVGKPISDNPKARFMLIRGAIVTQKADGSELWGMPGEVWNNSIGETVKAKKESTVLLVI